MNLKKRLIKGVTAGIIFGATLYAGVNGVNKLEEKLWEEIEESLRPTMDIIEKIPREYKNSLSKEFEYIVKYYRKEY